MSDEKKFFDAYEEAFYAASPFPQVGGFGKLWEVVKGLWAKGMNPVVIISMIQSIMSLISQFSALSVEEIVAKVLALITPLV